MRGTPGVFSDSPEGEYFFSIIGDRGDLLTDRSAEVLIVGGGPVGLTLAVDLGRRGVDCTLIDKRPAPGMLPKMERCNARTMEHFRRLGIVERVRERGFDSDLPMDVFIVNTLTEEPILHHPYPSINELKERARKVNDGSEPLEPYQLISQYTLEPLLKEVAEELDSVDVRFGHELVGFVQDDDGVVATIRDDGGLETVLNVPYLVGCDGGSSLVRKELGFQLEGESNLLELHQALFRCEDLFDRIPIGKGRHYHVADDRATFLIVQDDCKHFSLHAIVDRPEEMEEIFERIVDMPIDYETLYIGPWTQRLMLADGYQKGRVLIAGDAAHLVIPTGGLGMNTGAGDAIDLSWKLAGTIQGWGGPELLASYEQERRPIGARNVDASTQASVGRRTWRACYDPAVTEDSPAGEAARARLAEVADREQRKSNDLYGIEMGYRYETSPLIIHEAGEWHEDGFTYVPSARPGSRLPHIWLADGSALHDRLGFGYSLVTQDGDAPGVSDLVAAFARAGAPFEVVRIDSDAARDVYGAEHVVVRPDLHVVWRGDRLDMEVDAFVRTVTGHRL